MIGHLDSFAPIDEGITWDVIVIGAGPAGAVAARQSALAGMRTLLLDRRDFPRSKVCGGCLNGHCLAVLDRIGLSHLPGNLHAEPLSAFRLHAGGRQVTLPMPAGAAVSRAAFDAALVDAAVTAGARFLPRTSARVDDVVGNGGSTLRPVRLTGHGQPETKAVARVVIAADGLTHSSLRDQSGFDSRIARGTRVGIGAALTGCPGGYDRGTIGMAVARGGYVGLVRAEDGRLIVAAALDPHFVKQCGSPQRSVHEVLDDAGVAVPGSLVDIGWQGTVGLTRRTARTAGHRLLVIGDAAGYVEPLTGSDSSDFDAFAASIRRQATRLIDRSMKDDLVRKRRFLDLKDRRRRMERAGVQTQLYASIRHRDAPLRVPVHGLVE